MKKLIVEGGSHVSGAFVNAGLVDEVSVFRISRPNDIPPQASCRVCQTSPV
ncbi:MAG: probable riboflavin-specific deaminase [uncultured Paraburkholderia sp.]|nr:MAG: probable riboflavin-specific deaminase [uncultured Paraburkholderia sp.]CAH2915714.1 MAG: probable riboflavin-specific deaminase [uncultured Paraburkholderia sp.]